MRSFVTRGLLALGVQSCSILLLCGAVLGHAQTATPSFVLPAGAYPRGKTVAISDATSGATIYYTTNGTTPTTASAVYVTPVTVDKAETIQAIAISSGAAQSAVASAQYTVMPNTTNIYYALVGDNLANDIANGCPADTTITCEVMLPAGSVFSGYNASGQSATRPNVNIIGVGMGTYASLTNSTADYIIPQSASAGPASIIQCRVELTTGANNWRLHDLSVDVGDALVSAGICREGNGINANSPYQRTQSPPIQYVSINNVSILLRNSTSPFHAFKCENVTNCQAYNSYALFGTHGFVGKFGSNFEFHNLWSAGHKTDCAIFKSGTDGFVYATLNGAYAGGITCTFAQPGDTQGFEIDAQNGTMSGIYLSNLNLQGTLSGVFAAADSQSSISNMQIYGLNYVAAPYAGGSGVAHDALVLAGSISSVYVKGLVSQGADACTSVANASTAIGKLTIVSPQCINTFANIFYVGAGATTTISSPSITHTPANSSPTITCNTVGGAITSSSCTTTAGSGLWYNPGVSFLTAGCSSPPGVQFAITNNAVSGYAVTAPGAGCPATITGVVTPNWNSVDFFNQGTGSITTVTNPLFNGEPTEEIGTVSETYGGAPAVTFETTH